MMPEVELGLSIAYDALHETEDGEFAEKIRLATQAKQAKKRQARREKLGRLIIKFGNWVAKPSQIEAEWQEA